MVAEAWLVQRDLPVVLVPPHDVVNRDQFSHVFRTHYPGLCRLAYLIVGDGAVAEDVVQEAFLRTFAGVHRLREPAQLHLYLRRAVINASRSKLRRRGIEHRANVLFQAGARDGRRWDDECDTTVAVVEAVRRLPERQRAAVLLRYYLDLPEVEIAETLGTRVGTVKSQLAKARRNLGRTIAEPGDG